MENQVVVYGSNAIHKVSLKLLFRPLGHRGLVGIGVMEDGYTVVRIKEGQRGDVTVWIIDDTLGRI